MNKNLPIFAKREKILAAVEDHRAVVITAETGAGKSTQVPQYLAHAGYDVVITQPRRLAARSVAERVAEEMNSRLGGRVGYRTGFSRRDSERTQVLFCTDGLQLVREITGSGKAQVLVIDEVHEWNVNIETLVAWARKRLAEEAPFKVVLMSATLEANKLAAYFAEVTGECPVVDVPGRLYPVEKFEKPASSLTSEVIRLVKESLNVLVFQPGKREIAKTIEVLEQAQVDAEILPLHGQLDPGDQRRVFRHYGRPKVVVSTNVAQTSVTIDDIYAVVDAGTERRIELVDGVEGLYLKPTSQADCQQRAGRAGRTREGVYILCSETPLSSRPAFPVAEINRSRLDQLVLRLAVAGIDASELDFFHQPDKQSIVEAKRTCIALGFLTEEGQVTSLGRKAARLPIGVKLARMVLEAAQRGVLDDVLTIAAIMETGSLKSRDNNWKQLTQERESDPLAELDLYQVARGLSNGQMQQAGIFAKNYFRAKELRRKLYSALRGLVRFENGGSREDILRSVVAGMIDHLYQRGSRTRYGYNYENGESTSRRINNSSVVPDGTDWVVGLPFDLQVKTRRGGRITLNLIEWVTRVDPTWLVEVAPQLAGTERRNYRYDGQQGIVVCDLVTKFNGQEIRTEVVEGSGKEAVRALAEAFASGKVDHPSVSHNRQVCVEVEELNSRVGQTLGTIKSSELSTWYELQLGEIHTLAEAQNLDLNLTDEDISLLLGIEDYAAKRARICQERPETWSIAGEDHALTYEWSTWSFRGVKITLPVAVITELDSSQLPAWEGMKVRVTVADEGYTSLYVTLPDSDLGQLREKIEARRRELAWKAFRVGGHGDYDHKVEVAYQDPLPELPNPKVWDQLTGATAYPAWLYYRATSGEEANSTWYLRWYQTEEQALEARQEARAKKQEVDAEEYERRHFKQLAAEAQALYKEVEGLFGQIDWGNYGVYGITSDEASTYRYHDQSLRNRLYRAKTQAFGDSWNKAQPTQAIEALQNLEERLEAALERFQENEQQKPNAQILLEIAEDLYQQVEAGYNRSDISWSERNQVRDALRGAELAFESHDYVEAIEKAKEVERVASPILEALKLKRQARQVLEELVEVEYDQTLCPVCNKQLGLSRDGDYHTCGYEFDEQLAAAYQDKSTDVKTSSVGEDVIVRVEIVPYGRSQEEFDLYLRVNESVLPASMDEVDTRVHWHAPSEEELVLQSELKQVEKVYDLWMQGQVVVLNLQEGKHQGKTQWGCKGQVRGVTIKYVVDRYSTLPERFAGGVWLCEETKVIHQNDSGTFKIQAVKPLIPLDTEDESEISDCLQARVREIQKQLADFQQAEEPLGDHDEVVKGDLGPATEDELTAFAAHFNR